jgi:carboxylesterase
MNIEDFRYMRRGKHLSALTQQDMALMKPINQRNQRFDRALLVLHGFSSSPAVYRLLIPELKHYDAIVCPTLSGHAQSIDAFSQSSASQWVSSASKACDALIKEYKTVDVLGLSLGGLLACELSHHFPINHLYLLAPALKLYIHIPAMILLAQVLSALGFRYLRNAAGNLFTNEQAEIAYRKLPISTILEILQLVRDHKWVAPTCPTDLFLGRFDEVVASNEVEQLFASLPNATVHWLEHSAHVLPLDSDLKEIVDCINLVGTNT